MDRLDEISLSRIATILDRHSIIRTNNNSIWERILSNAGQSELYDRFSIYLYPYSYNGSWENPNLRFEEFYSAIKNILKIVYSSGQNTADFNLLMSSIIEEIDIKNVFDGDLENILPGYRYYSLKEFFQEKTDDECLNFIKEKSSLDFQVLINNLNILNLDITYKNGILKLAPFTQQSVQITRNPSLLVDWLTDNYSSIGELYQEAIENYIDGEPVSCISNCRNILTGIFSNFKEDGSKSWVKGLQNLSTDTNIENITVPNNIVQGSADRDIPFETDNVFKYPRFKLIYHLYFRCFGNMWS